MRARSVSLQAAMAVTALLEVTSADLCSMGSKVVKGNWYCQAVQRIAYKGVGGQGSYNKITHMDPITGACSSSPQPFSGSMSPLDEDISLHFRAPLKLKQFAVYKPTSDNPQTHLKGNTHARRHAHSEFHQHAKKKRDVGDMVTATIDGQVVSWVNLYDGQAKATPAEPATFGSTAVPNPHPAPVNPQIANKYKAPPGPVNKGDWAQVAYFNSEEGKAHGLTFLNNRGGQGSGVFDYKFGSSLSYASTDASSGAASPGVFGGTLEGTDEISIFSEESCDTTDCGYVRPGTVAYKGFSGPSKAFFMEFMMPDDGSSGWNRNMPAIWALNAQIPRTAQYASCSCWKSGCGEFDIFETLHSGSSFCKSTLHGGVNGGSSDYFTRPASKYMKAAVIFH
ncbi:hypothetical protein EJ08DRAFT_622322, partial [Tothia fuscella]